MSLSKLACALVTLLMLGCASSPTPSLSPLSLGSWRLPETKLSKAKTASPGTGELPLHAGELADDEAVRACMTTASELMKNGHAREASQLWEKARTLNPQIDCSKQLAAAYDLQGNIPKSKLEFEKALQVTPDDPDLLNDYGCFLDRQGAHEEAQHFLRKAIERSSDSERARVNLGASLARQGRLQESFDEFASTIGPAAAHSNIGVILAGQGKDEEAANAFREALRLNPDLPQARTFLAALNKASTTSPELAKTKSN